MNKTKNKNMNNKKNENYIIAEINIKESDLNSDIKIINSYEQYKRDINFEKREEEYENEKELKENCEIKINDNKIKFSYFNQFKKAGKYTIKYLFKKNLINTGYIFGNCNSLTSINLSYFSTLNVTNMRYMFLHCNSLKYKFIKF